MSSPFTPANDLQQVITYQTEVMKLETATLKNSYVAMSKLTNKKIENFDKFVGNLGDTVNIALPPRSTVTYGLTGPTETEQQRLVPLILCQAAASKSAFDEMQYIFNLSPNDYFEKFRMGRVTELGAKVEVDLLKNFVSGSVVLDPNRTSSPLPGTIANPKSGPYRFYGDGKTIIPNTYQLLDTAVEDYNAYGSSKFMRKGVIPNTVKPQVVGSGLSQFANKRNDEISFSWEIGNFGGTDWYTSNLLPVHRSGSVGDSTVTDGNKLTLVSTNDPSGDNVTQLTFSGAPVSDVNAIKAGDLFQFIITAGQPRLNYLTFTGHEPSSAPVQCRVLNDAESDSSGNVTVNIYPALQWTTGKNQNLNYSLQPGMRAAFVPSHRAGCLMSGDAFFAGMPMLSDMSPFTSLSISDPDSGIGFRHYWGSDMTTVTKKYVMDIIWGSLLVADNCMRLIYPLSEGY